MIDSKFLGNPQDLEDLGTAFTITRKLIEMPVLSAYNKSDIRNAEVQTDEQIRFVLRNYVHTVYHPVGSCKMAVDYGAIIDPALRVICIQGLRIVDASIMPILIDGNANATVTMSSGFYP